MMERFTCFIQKQIQEQDKNTMICSYLCPSENFHHTNLDSLNGQASTRRSSIY